MFRFSWKPFPDFHFAGGPFLNLEKPITFKTELGISRILREKFLIKAQKRVKQLKKQRYLRKVNQHSENH